MTECDGKRCRQHSDGQQAEEIGERRRVLIRMGAVGVEEAAAVGPQVLDELQRCHRSLSDSLNSTLQCVGFRVRPQIERHALPDQYEAAHQGQR